MVELEDGLPVVLVVDVKHLAVVALEQAVLAAVDDLVEHPGGFGVLVLPEIGLAEHGLGELLGHLPCHVVVDVGLLKKASGIDGLGEVLLHQTPKFFGG